MALRDVGLRGLKQEEMIAYRARVRELTPAAVQKLQNEYGAMLGRNPEKTAAHDLVLAILAATKHTLGGRSDEALVVDFLRGRLDRGVPAAARTPVRFRQITISNQMRVNMARAAAAQPPMYTPNGVGIATQYSEFFELKKEMA